MTRLVRWLAKPAPKNAIADQILVWIAAMLLLLAATLGGGNPA